MGSELLARFIHNRQTTARYPSMKSESRLARPATTHKAESRRYRTQAIRRTSDRIAYARLLTNDSCNRAMGKPFGKKRVEQITNAATDSLKNGQPGSQEFGPGQGDGGQ
jgi:hypothetical protein